MSKYRILVADNDNAARDNVADYLVEAGYEVLTASNPIEAEKIMLNERIHLAILDNRMQDDDDENDRSGLLLAQKAARGIPKLIWTAFPTVDDVVEVLKQDGHTLPPAVDFVSKRMSYEELAERVEKSLNQYAKYNWNLMIDWDGGQTILQLLQAVILPTEFVHLNDRIQEMEDLFRKLFYTSEQITVGRFFLQEDRRVIIPVFTYQPNEQSEQYIVSIGVRDIVEKETTLFQTAVPQPIRTQKISFYKSAETLHFMATAFTFIGGNLQDSELLETVFDRETPQNLKAITTNLLETNLLVWHRQARQQRSTTELVEFYKGIVLGKIKITQLKEKVDAICSQASKLGLVLLQCTDIELKLVDEHQNEYLFRHPLTLFENNHFHNKTAVSFGQVHGCVCRESILVNEHANTWLINYLYAKTGPIAHDYASLESIIKRNLLQSDQITARLALENHFLLSDSFVPTEPLIEKRLSFDKIARMINVVRHQAQRYSGVEWYSYRLCLYFIELDYINQFDLSQRVLKRQTLVRFVHALITASLIASQLSTELQPELPPQAITHIWLDENKKVLWREGNAIDLTPQEFDVIQFLFEHVGKTCSKRDIVVIALKDSTFDPLDKKQERLHTIMSRLINKIEPDKKNRQYLFTVRGHGYMLNP